MEMSGARGCVVPRGEVLCRIMRTFGALQARGLRCLVTDLIPKLFRSRLARTPTLSTLKLYLASRKSYSRIEHVHVFVLQPKTRNNFCQIRHTDYLYCQGLIGKAENHQLHFVLEFCTYSFSTSTKSAKRRNTQFWLYSWTNSRCSGSTGGAWSCLLHIWLSSLDLWLPSRPCTEND